MFCLVKQNYESWSRNFVSDDEQNICDRDERAPKRNPKSTKALFVLCAGASLFRQHTK